MVAYALKVYLMNGDWGYISSNLSGGFQLSKEISQALCFPSKSELMDFYKENVKYGDSNGVPVDTSRTCAVTVNY